MANENNIELQIYEGDDITKVTTSEDGAIYFEETTSSTNVYKKTQGVNTTLREVGRIIRGEGTNSLIQAGTGCTASGDNSIALGKYNIDDENNLFVIGNGTQSNPKNALTVTKTGTAKFNSDVEISGAVTIAGEEATLKVTQNAEFTGDVEISGELSVKNNNTFLSGDVTLNGDSAKLTVNQPTAFNRDVFISDANINTLVAKDECIFENGLTAEKLCIFKNGISLGTGNTSFGTSAPQRYLEDGELYFVYDDTPVVSGEWEWYLDDVTLWQDDPWVDFHARISWCYEKADTKQGDKWIIPINFTSNGSKYTSIQIVPDRYNIGYFEIYYGNHGLESPNFASYKLIIDKDQTTFDNSSLKKMNFGWTPQEVPEAFEELITIAARKVIPQE